MGAEELKLKFPEGADAIYIADEYGLALPMKKSRKHEDIYYYHEKYFQYGYVSRKTAMKYAGYLIFRDGRMVRADPVKIVSTAPWNPLRIIVYIVKVRSGDQTSA